MLERALPNPISCFRDALGLAMQLHHEELENCTTVIAVVLLSRDGHCIDFGLFRDRSVESATNWAIRICRTFHLSAEPGNKSRAESALLIAASSATPGMIRESDLDLFRSARWSLSTVGTELLDWIETDGDHVRSFAHLTCPATAWPAPHHR